MTSHPVWFEESALPSRPLPFSKPPFSQLQTHFFGLRPVSFMLLQGKIGALSIFESLKSKRGNSLFRTLHRQESSINRVCIVLHSVQSLSCVRLFATLWTAACQASLSITNSQSLLKLMSIESVMPSNHLILCCPLLLLPSIFPSIGVFSNESVLCIRWPRYWSFSFSIRPSNEYSGLISFRIDWLDYLAVTGTLKSLFQHHCSKASCLQCSTFFMTNKL